MLKYAGGNLARSESTLVSADDVALDSKNPVQSDLGLDPQCQRMVISQCLRCPAEM